MERGRGDQPWVLGTQTSMLCPVKYRFFIPCCIYTTQIIFLKIFLFFLFPPPQPSSLRELLLGKKKYWSGICPPLHTPKLCLWFLVCLMYFNSYYTQLPYLLIWICLKLSWLKCINVRNLVHKSKKACLTSSKSLQTSRSD